LKTVLTQRRGDAENSREGGNLSNLQILRASAPLRQKALSRRIFSLYFQPFGMVA